MEKDNIVDATERFKQAMAEFIGRSVVPVDLEAEILQFPEREEPPELIA